ncbi:MAG: DNA repair protein RecO [Myxococcales bacterium]|nr:DNA repair protein RecO [Myxococcales bacterium]
MTIGSNDAQVSEALVARAVDYGEADRVLTLLTAQMGRVSALARSARRSRKRFGGALALFVVGRAALKPRRGGGEMWTLERFEAVEDLSAAISADVVKIAHGSYMLEVARDSWPPGEHDPQRFALVRGALRALGAAPEPSPSLLRAFELQVLLGAGVLPSLDACARCGADVAEDELAPLGFSVTLGGVICLACGAHGWPLEPEVRRELRELAAVDIASAAARSPDREVRLRCRELCAMLVQHHLGHAPKSLEFIAKLR